MIIQLRDAARTAGAKNKKPGGRGLHDLRSIINSVVEGRAITGMGGPSLADPLRTAPVDPGEASSSQPQETPMEVDAAQASNGRSCWESCLYSGLLLSNNEQPVLFPKIHTF